MIAGSILATFLAAFCPALLRRERGGPQGQTRFCGACWSLSELQLVATKGGKNAAGVPPDPRLLADFLFMKIGVNYREGARGSRVSG